MKRFLQMQLVRFGMTGGLGAAIQIGFLYLFGTIFNIWYLAASIIAYICSISIGFTLHKFWTFDNKNSARIHIQFSAYALIFGINLMLNTALMHLFVEQFALWYIFAQALTCVILAVPSFFLYKYLVFRSSLSY